MYKIQNILGILFIFLLFIPFACADAKVLWKKEVNSNINIRGIDYINMRNKGFEVLVSNPAIINILFDGSLESIKNIQTPSSDGMIYDFTKITDNNFLFASVSTDYVRYMTYTSSLRLIKMNETGVHEWEKVFTYDVNDIYPWHLIETKDNGFLVSGELDEWSNDRLYSFVLKTNKDGEIQWEDIYDDGIYSFIDTIFETSEGDYIIAGGYSTDGDDSNKWIKKLDTEGKEVWMTQDGELDIMNIHDIEQANDQGIIIVARTISNFENPYSAVIKLDYGGNLEWIKKHDLKLYPSIKPLIDGNYVITSEGVSLIKINSTGDIIWKKNISTHGSDTEAYVEVIENNNLLFTKNDYFVFSKTEILKNKTYKSYKDGKVEERILPLVDSRHLWVTKIREIEFKPSFYIFISLLIIISITITYLLLLHKKK
tara:strand:+ start:1516 stop:2796 length:1281 start_codon:yes stop_codon:yes gene_type:complete